MTKSGIGKFLNVKRVGDDSIRFTDFSNPDSPEEKVVDIRHAIYATELLDSLDLISVDKDGDGFICKEAMGEIREIIAKVRGEPLNESPIIDE